MSTYVMFTSVGGYPTDSTKCTTVWPSNISCSIVISGMIETNYYNLMVMDCEASALTDWINENSTKVEIITKEQADALGQSIVPPGTERVERDMFDDTKEKVYRAGVFDVDNPGDLWTLVEERSVLS